MPYVQPYVADYDAVHENYRVPSWIVETIETRNTVTVMSNVSEDIQKIQRKLKQYKNEPQEFLEGYFFLICSGKKIMQFVIEYYFFFSSD